MRGSVPQERHRWVLLIGVLVWVHHFHLFHFGHVDANNKVLKEYIEWYEKLESFFFLLKTKMILFPHENDSIMCIWYAQVGIQ